MLSYFRDVEDAKKYSTPERKSLKADVRKGIDSLISGAKARSVRGTRRPSLVRDTWHMTHAT